MSGSNAYVSRARRRRLFKFEAMTFARASAAAIEDLSGPAPVAFVGNNVLRRRDLWALFEGSRTNSMTQSDDPVDWPLGAGATFVNDYGGIADPTGAFLAGRIVTDGSQANYAMASRQDADTTAGGYRAFSIWLRDDVNTTAHDYSWQAAVGGGTGAGSVTNNNSPPTGRVWRRDSGVFVVTGTPTFFQLQVVNDPNTTGAPGSPTGDALLFYGAQFEIGAQFPSSTIARTDGAAGTRSPDTGTLANGLYSTRMQSGRWGFWAAPIFGSTDTSNTDEYVTHSIGGANDRLRIVNNGGSVQISVVAGGAVKVASNVLTFSRLQPMRVLVDSVAGTIEVRGATSGDGMVAGTAWTWPASTLRVGGIQGANTEAFCWLTESYAA